MAKFICEPVKYKQLYRWSVAGAECARHTACSYPTCSGWKPSSGTKLNFVITQKKRRGKYPAGFYIAPYDVPDPLGGSDRTNECARWRWLGPYPDLPTAKSVAEVFITLRQGPRWVWKRPKKEK
jgi:hypothetical protein